MRALKDSSLASIQMDADPTYSSLGKKTPSPWLNEDPSAYRRRIATDIKHLSPKWKNVDLHELRGQALFNAATEIFADAQKSVADHASYGESLHEVRSRDEAGHTIRKFYGSPEAMDAPIFFG